ncbi:MAG: hypothetical protein K8823_1525 [Cenarchaeum symbiont of Oopsacas minuta]|nr:hypothetical protein [Cenarchaeum symbiont of Oopsacas minuta]
MNDDDDYSILMKKIAMGREMIGTPMHHKPIGHDECDHIKGISLVHLAGDEYNIKLDFGNFSCLYEPKYFVKQVKHIVEWINENKDNLNAIQNQVGQTKNNFDIIQEPVKIGLDAYIEEVKQDDP